MSYLISKVTSNNIVRPFGSSEKQATMQIGMAHRAQRVLFIAGICYPKIGGAVTTLQSWLDALQFAGRHASIYTATLDAPDRTLSLGNASQVYRSKHFHRWFHLSRFSLGVLGDELLKIGGRVRPDIVVAMDLYAAILGALVSAQLDIPLVLTFHETPNPPKKIIGRIPQRPELELAWSKMIFRQLHYDHLIAQSQFFLEWALRCGADRRKATALYSGVDTNSFSPNALLSTSLRRVLGDGEIVFCPARIAPRKRIEDLIVAISRVIIERPGLRLALIWYVDDAPRSYVRTLEREIKRLNLKRSIIRLQPVARFEMPGLYKRSQLVVLPSEIEGLGISLLESLACGTPVVATDVPGIREVIAPNATGLLVPAHNPGALAKGILRVLRSTQLRGRFSRRGRTAVLKRFSKRAADKKLIRILDELVSR